MIDTCVKPFLHLYGIRTVDVPCFSCFDEILFFEVLCYSDDSTTISHGISFEDVVAIKEPISRCLGMGISLWNESRVFRREWRGPSFINVVAYLILEGFSGETTIAEGFVKRG